jgi:hypothetical protein
MSTTWERSAPPSLRIALMFSITARVCAAMSSLNVPEQGEARCKTVETLRALLDRRRSPQSREGFLISARYSAAYRRVAFQLPRECCLASATRFPKSTTSRLPCAYCKTYVKINVNGQAHQGLIDCEWEKKKRNVTLPKASPLAIS